MPLSDLKRKVYDVNQRGFALAILHAADPNSPVTLAGLRTMLQAGGEDMDAEDFFAPSIDHSFPVLVSRDGSVLAIKLIKEVLDILHERGQNVSIDDFTKRYLITGKSILEAAAQAGVLKDLFSSSYWIGNTKDMELLWQELPRDVRNHSGVDFPELKAHAEASVGPEFKVGRTLEKAQLFSAGAQEVSPLDDPRTWKKLPAILKALAHKGETLSKADLLQKSRNGATFLELGFAAGQREAIVETLTHNGEKITQQDIRDHKLGRLFITQSRKLWNAVNSEDFAAAQSLLASGFVDVDYAPHGQGTALLQTVSSDYPPKIAKALIDAGADVTYKHNRSTVLNVAVWNARFYPGNKQIVSSIVSALEKRFGDDHAGLLQALTDPDGDGDTPLNNAESDIAPIISKAIARVKKHTIAALDATPHKRVAIIGAGFSGTVTAIHLLRAAREPLEIMMVEKSEARRSGGIAYSKETASDEHLTNIPIDRMSAFGDDRADLLRWLEDADRDNWPERYKHKDFQANESVPRKLYQLYLEQRLHEAIDENNGALVKKVSGDAIDVIDHEDRATVVFKNGKSYDANQVILATGYTTPKEAKCAEKIKDSTRYIGNQHSAEGKQKVKSIRKDDTVFVVGTGLSAYDAVLSLAEQGHTGKIILCSRHGYTHPAYPRSGIESPLGIRRPEFMNAATLPELITLLRKDFWEQTVVLGHAPERVVEAYQHHIPELMKKFPHDEVRQLLRDHNSLITTLRVGVSSDIARVVEHAKISGQLQILPANIHDMNIAANGISIRYTPSGSSHDETITVDRVMSCLGKDTVKDDLWHNLARRGLMQPHFTGHGIQVGEEGQLVDALGKESEHIIAVGPMRGGDSMERTGTLGPVAFAVPNIRGQTSTAAELALERLEQQQPIVPHAFKIHAEPTVLGKQVFFDKTGRTRYEISVDTSGSPVKMEVFTGHNVTPIEVHTPGRAKNEVQVVRYSGDEAQPAITKRFGQSGFMSWKDVLALQESQQARR